MNAATSASAEVVSPFDLAPPVPAEPVDYDNPLHQKFTPAFRRLELPKDTESRLTRFMTWSIAFVIAGLYLYALLCYWAPAHPGVDCTSAWLRGSCCERWGQRGLRSSLAGAGGKVGCRFACSFLRSD